MPITIQNQTGAAITLHLSMGETVMVSAGGSTNINEDEQVDTIDYNGATYALNGIWPWTGIACNVVADHYASNTSIYLQNPVSGVGAIFPRQGAGAADRKGHHAPRHYAPPHTRVAATVKEGSPLYKVLFSNETGVAGSVFLYQEHGANVPGVLPLAWLSGWCPPHFMVDFEWRPDLAMYWGHPGALSLGTVVTPSQMLPCTPTSGNEATLTLASTGELLLTGQATSPTSGIAVMCDDTVPAATASIGVAMSGACVSAVPAVPETISVFDTTPIYRIAFSQQQLAQGSVLPPSISVSQLLDFPAGVTTCRVSLDLQGVWSVTYGS